MSTFTPGTFPKRADTEQNEVAAYVDQRIPQAAQSGLVALSNAQGDITWTTAANAASTLGYEQTSNKAAASGYASLGADTRVPNAQLPIPELARLAPQKTKWENNSGAGPATNGASVTLHTLTNQGILRAFWIACGATTAKDVRLQITADGAGSPDVDIDLGTLFLLHNSYTNFFQYSTQHWHSELSGTNFSGFLRFPMPFSSGLTIKLVGTAAHGAWNYWSQAIYQPLTSSAAVPAYRMKSQGVRQSSAVTVAQASAYNFFDVTPANGGYLVWMGMEERSSPANTASWSYLERNVQLTVDTSADIVSSGTEDFFLGSFYYQSDTGYDTPASAITEAGRPTYVTNQGLDLLALCGGVKFNSELKADLLTEAAVVVDHTMSWVALYLQGV